MKNKKCFICNESKPISEYYKHPRMGDGHLGKCKTCTKSGVKKREDKLRKDPAFVESEKIRAREKYRRLGYKDQHKPTREMKRKAMDKYKDKYPEKMAANSHTSGIKAGDGMQNHHWSYNKEHWKDVIAMTIAHHAIIHRYITYDQERMMYRMNVQTDFFFPNELLDTRERHEQAIEYLLHRFNM